MAMMSRSGPLIPGLWARCAQCRRHVTEHTSRWWHSDEDGPLILCYTCFDARKIELMDLPAERDAYMREILANEARGQISY
jgi:hypothetical protein